MPCTVQYTCFQYVPVCKIIQRDCPDLVEIFHKLDAILEQESQKLAPSFGEEASSVMDICDRNRARLNYGRKQALDCMNLVENAIAKIHAALLW